MAAKLDPLEGFFVSLGFDVDDEGLSDMAAKVRQTASLMRTFTQWIVGPSAAGFALLSVMTAKAADSLNDFAVAEDIALKDLQELGFAAENTGSSVDAVKNSIQGLNQVAGEAALGLGRGAATFRKLGISVKNANGDVKNASELLTEVASRMQGMSLQESIGLASKLGIDRSMVTLLRGGAEALEDLKQEARELGIVEDEQVQKGVEFAGSYRRILFVIQNLKNELILNLLPSFKRIVDNTREWLKLNRDWINSGLTAAIKIFTSVLGFLWNLLRGFVTTVIDIVKWLTQFKLVMWAIIAAVGAFIAIGTARVFGVITIAVIAATRALMAFNFAAALIPALIGAAILAVGLLIEDFIVWRNGGRSLIGEILNKYPKAVEEIKKFLDPVRSLVQFFTEAFNAAAKFGNYIRDTLGGIVMDVWKKIDKFFGVLGVFSPTASTSNTPLMNQSVPSSGILGSAAGSSSTSNTQIQTQSIGSVNVNIQTNDPAKAGESVKEELGKMAMGMTRNFQSQVVA